MTLTDILRPAEAAMDRVTVGHKPACFWLALVALALFLPGYFTLQPMDADESRFAQASKQMLETDDFISIRLQDEARNKKPVGIYWLQAGTVAVAESLGFPDARRTIWLYRLPALLGAVSGVLLTYWAALAFGSRRMAFLAAMLFASTILIGVEARLAKTDAVVTATVVAAMGVLGRVYLAKRSLPLARGDLGREGARATAVVLGGRDHDSEWGGPPPQPSPTRGEGVKGALPFLFWAAIGIGILIKGPITPMVPALAATALVVKDRAWRWLARLRPLSGLLLTVAIAAPWLVAIMIETHGAFLTDSIGGDLLAKVASGKENHGTPPGSYLLAFLVTGWPMAPFTILAAPFAWKLRREPAIAFLLAWIIPAWLVFEAVPTKLPHYVLPLYPAIAILTALAIEKGGLALNHNWRRRVILLVPGIALVLAVAGAVAAFSLHTVPGWLYFACLPLLLWQALRWIVEFSRLRGREDLGPMVADAALLAFLVYVLVWGGLLTTSFFAPFAISPRLAEARRAALAVTPDCSALAAAAAGYHNPSLIFLTETDILLTDGPHAGAFLAAAPCRVAFVDGRQETAFKAALGNAPGVRLVDRVQGTNLNGGTKLDIGVYVRQGTAR